MKKTNKGFSKKENIILSEIYRRLNYFHKGNLNEPLMLLALPSDVKIIKEYGLIMPYGNKETPRIFNWYSLTEKGKQFFSHYIENIDEETNTKLYNVELIKEFNPEYL